MLPDGSGLEWLADLRSRNDRTRVLVLTARDAIDDRVAGLDTGADDYLVKPFSLQELLARVRALLRRDASNHETLLTYQDLSVDLVRRTAVRGETVLALQNRQFELLVYLLKHVNQIVTREMIACDVWKEPTATWTNVIEVQINHLRKKLEIHNGPTILHTLRNKGYMLGDAP
jgi:DNA-binding response OmpR family regulator